MRAILTTILFAGVIYLSSCSTKDDRSPNLLVVPSIDSVTKNSSITITIGTDSFVVHDLTVKNVPVEYLVANNVRNPTDSTYSTTIVLKDYLSKVISMNLTTYNFSIVPEGTYTVTDNTSTFTNYANGENKTYAVLRGSTLTLTHALYPLAGTLSLLLYYNTDTTFATGHFEIYY